MRKITWLCLVLAVFVLAGCKGKSEPAEPEETTAAPAKSVSPAKTAPVVSATGVVKCAVCGKEFKPSGDVGDKKIFSCSDCTAKSNQQMAQFMEVLKQMQSVCSKCGKSMRPKAQADGTTKLVCTGCGQVGKAVDAKK